MIQILFVPRKLNIRFSTEFQRSTCMSQLETFKRPSTREPCRGQYRGGVTDLAYNLHAVMTRCSIVKYGVVLV